MLQNTYRNQGLDTFTLEGFKHTYILGGPCLNGPPEGQKLEFRAGSPACFKTLTETKVWKHFLVEAGYLSFGLQKPPMPNANIHA